MVSLFVLGGSLNIEKVGRGLSFFRDNRFSDDAGRKTSFFSKDESCFCCCVGFRRSVSEAAVFRVTCGGVLIVRFDLFEIDPF